MRRCFLSLAGLIFYSVANAQTPRATAPDSPKCPEIAPVPQGPLGEVDRSFLDSYCAFKPAVLSHQPPYVVVSGSSLILHWSAQTNKQPDKQKGIPETYHALKDVAHIPFSAYLLLLPMEKGFATIDAQKPTLALLKDRIDKAETALDPAYFSAHQIARQRQILDASVKLLDTALQAGSSSKSTLLVFAKSMGPLMLQNAWEAGCDQIKTTHAQMMVWKKKLTADEWATLVVVNRARHQARYRNAATQYFLWLFGDESPSWSYPGESLRVIYAETLGLGEDTSDELATVVIDADASEAFFGNRWRLSEDILSEGAAACVAKLPPQDRTY